jgi:hypothetical protein
MMMVVEERQETIAGFYEQGKAMFVIVVMKS